MNVLIFGGTGLLGSAAAQIFIDRGHHVKTIALPPLPYMTLIRSTTLILWIVAWLWPRSAA